MSPDERAEAEAFGRSPDLLQRIGEDFERCGLVGESETRLLCYLAAVSRRTDEPLSVLILSSSGAGSGTRSMPLSRHGIHRDTLKMSLQGIRWIRWISKEIRLTY